MPDVYGVDTLARTRIIIAADLLIIPLALLGWWIVASGGDATHAEKVVRFLAPMPGFLHSTTVLTLVAIGFSMASALLAGMALRASGGWNAVAKVVMVVGWVLALWNLFSLM